jgi:endoglucanase
MAEGIGLNPAVILVEIDALGASACLDANARKLWDEMLDYEETIYSELPHAVVYLEAGYSDAQSPMWTANQLLASGVTHGRGFFTNDTHFAWSSNEIKWADEIDRILWAKTHHHYLGHFVVNTAQNGRGPKRNKNIVKDGLENLCNPPGRGLGRMPTGVTDPTFDGYRISHLDAFLWTGVPGRSHSNTCHPGDAPAGVFDPRFALQLAANANQQLGPMPAYRSQPY